MPDHIDGVVIKVNDYSDNDKICCFFTEKYGKITVIAKGARKNKSQHLSCCQLFVEGSYNLYKGKKMYTLNSCDSLKPNYKIRENLYAFAYTNLICELVYKILPEEDPHSNIYKMLVKTLGYMEKAEESNAQLFALAFIIKLIAMVGYKIQLKECSNCSKKDLEQPLYFSVISGGIVCKNCINPSDIKIDIEIYNLMNKLLYYKFEELDQIEYNIEIMSKVKTIIIDYLYYHSGISNLKSLDFIHSL